MPVFEVDNVWVGDGVRYKTFIGFNGFRTASLFVVGSPEIHKLFWFSNGRRNALYRRFVKSG